MKNAQPGLMMTLLLGVTLLLASCAAPSGGRGTPTGSAAPVAGMERPAAGATEDSLSACLARIPGDATAGQRMIAEGSCRRDAASRQAMDAVPGK